MVNGKDITMIRTLLGFHTQIEFSEAMGIAKSTISDIENDKKAISKDLMVKLVTHYGVDGTYLLTGNGKVFRNEANLTEEQLIGIRLRQIRSKKNISQISFSERINCSQGIISDIERGSKSISRSLLVSISKLYPDISLNWLLLGTGSMYLKAENHPLDKNAVSAKETGRRIKQIRQALGITQKELSEIIRVTPSNVSRCETGSQSIYSEVIFQLCRELGVCPNWLIAGYGEMFFKDNDQYHEEVLK